jgi:proteic killer suppression protein
MLYGLTLVGLSKASLDLLKRMAIFTCPLLPLARCFLREFSNLLHRSTAIITLGIIIAARYYNFMIKSFADKETEKLFQRKVSKRLSQDIQRKGRIKLAILDAAEKLQDLKIPPGKQLEKLSGDRKDQHIIRIKAVASMLCLGKRRCLRS